MARTGRPKTEKPINRSVTVKFKEEDVKKLCDVRGVIRDSFVS